MRDFLLLSPSCEAYPRTGVFVSLRFMKRERYMLSCAFRGEHGKMARSPTSLATPLAGEKDGRKQLLLIHDRGYPIFYRGCSFGKNEHLAGT